MCVPSVVRSSSVQWLRKHQGQPMVGVSIPNNVVDPQNTPHYTPEQAENMVTALVDHVDAQLVLTLACFLGLGPAEISGLQWVT